VVLAVAAAACGTPSPPVKTGTGVSNTAIRLGVLSDLSGPFGPLGEAVVQGNQLYVDKLNAGGGVCGRKVELDVQDTGFDTDKAVQLYFKMEPTVLGLLQVVGSDITSKITPDMLQQQVMAAPTSWSSDLLGNPYMVVVGATYDLDVINSLDYLVRQGMLHQGDVIGHIYNDDPEYGGNALLGSQFVADKMGLQLKAVQVASTKTDFTAEIAQLKAAGAKAIAISTYPQQTAVAVGTAAAVGLNVPFLVSNPGFDPSVLASPVGPAFQQLVLVSSSVAPFGAKLPAAEELATAYKAKFPNGKPSMAVDYGYVVGIGYGAILKRACEEGDLTRPGVQKAFHELTGVDTGGLTAPLLFSSSNYPSSRQSFVLRPNPKTVGGLDIVDPLKESDLVRQRIG
jgi:ABC-type branched-subunit amino acid transport system substrate-binding protein